MQTKHLCVLIHVRNKGEVGAVRSYLSPPEIFLLTDPKRCFFAIYVSCLPVSYCVLCSLQPCDHLPGEG